MEEDEEDEEEEEPMDKKRKLNGTLENDSMNG